MAIIGQDIDQAKAFLQNGELVAIPTETVYGLAANALNVEAVTKIFAVKQRPSFDPLIVHVNSYLSALNFVIDFPAKAKRLAEIFWPGPLTIVLEKRNIIPDMVTSGLDTVGIRCPDHALTMSLLNSLSFPLAAPSANPFGYVSPTRASHVEDQLGEKIPYILDGGACDVGVESTIIGFEEGQPVIYRIGGLGIEEIEKVIGSVAVQPYSTSNPKAPGQLKSHYAPRVKLLLGDLTTLIQQYSGARYGVLSFSKDYQARCQNILSPSGDLEEAARNLFTALRSFDAMPIDIVLAELVPETGLGRAINDRLRRAAAE